MASCLQIRRRALHLTQDRINLFPGLKSTVVGKICDFCDKDLPKEWTSLQCTYCPIIYDICKECDDKQEIKTCHKSSVVDGKVVHGDYDEKLTMPEKLYVKDKLKDVRHALLAFDRDVDRCEKCRIEDYNVENCENYILNYINFEDVRKHVPRFENIQESPVVQFEESCLETIIRFY